MTAVETPQAPRKAREHGPERAVRGEPPGWLVRLRRQKLASYVILLVFAVLYIGPLLMLVTTAFKTLPEFFQNPTGMPESLRFENFTEAWNEAQFARYLINSVVYTTVATAVCVVTSVLVAFPIARGYLKGGKYILLLYVIALFLPPALIPQFQLILNLGLFNTRAGYILLFLVNPIGIIILVNYIKAIPRELDESAAIDGCGYYRFVFKIIVPLIRPAIATVTVLHAIGLWNELVLAIIYLTNDDLYPVTRGLIAFEGLYGANWPPMAAAVLILMTPMVVLFLFLQRYIVSGLTAGAVKG
ncbi:MAG: carbohydrate ABC transporter permease [Acidimicrobiaceae bacterium]|nr:carbohydrate ABC transporter permease [Acidimicrobiaceae bacterium]MXZ67265.1 carbohydrate ABC transporter permease [Acidimicrobiaceae bacterium]MXZ95108.1 carbohydrate ABC transporter permease [Acidimicrobiaceae bacterium]MYF32580.1 carbohydrate ABC transporter permease [Acidimicrobiaceae bacterium]MYF43463.1 carbohydrate ABC transporter permease [Acidimicrobiaceae bacterium]